MSWADRIVIVGGGPAGHAAARGYREAGGSGTVLMVTDDDRPPYNRPPLTKEFLRGDATEDDLPMDELAGVEIVHGTAVRLEPDLREVHLGDGRRLDYTGCVLAPGARPVRLPVPGADDPRVHTVRYVGDSAGLREAVADGTRVTVIGTGFIGCEAAASLAMRGADVTLIGQEAVPQAARLGTTAGSLLANFLIECDVHLRLGVEIERVDDLDADVIVMATGVAPRVDLAREAGLRMGAEGIAADVALRTTAPDVYAAGDACEAQHPIAGRPLRVEHWGDALAQGEAAGRRLAGDTQAEWDDVPGFWSTIGGETLKYAAWGDGYATDTLVDQGDGSWTVWYADADGACVGALCHDRDDDYEEAKRCVAAGDPAPLS